MVTSTAAERPLFGLQPASTPAWAHERDSLRRVRLDGPAPAEYLRSSVVHDPVTFQRRDLPSNVSIQPTYRELELLH
jgi:hypothetical protein